MIKLTKYLSVICKVERMMTVVAINTIQNAIPKGQTLTRLSHKQHGSNVKQTKNYKTQQEAKYRTQKHQTHKD